MSADSADYPVLLADALIAGVPGDRVEAILDADNAVLEAVGPDEHVLVQADGITRPFAIRDLLGGSVVYTFERADTVHLHYFVDRRVRVAPRDGLFELSQRLKGSARLVGERFIHAKSAVAKSLDAPGFGCYATGAITNVCGNTVTLSPYAPAEHFNATFQSNPGNGQSFPITVTFRIPVKSVTVTIYDSDFLGNSIVAYDTLGNLLDSVSFDYDSIPQNGAINQAKTLASDSGIARVEIHAADGDYVAYDLVFVNLYCMALDSALDDLNSRKQMAAEWKSSHDEGLERAGWVYKNKTDGSYVWVFYDLGRTNCTSNTAVEAPELVGYAGVAPWHTHPLKPNTWLPTSCPKWTGPNDRVTAGPGTEDRLAIRKIKNSDRMFIIDTTQVYNLHKNHQVPINNWRNPSNCKWL